MWTDWCFALLCQTLLLPVILLQASKYRPFVRRRYFLPFQLNGNIRLPMFLLLRKELNLCVGRHELPDLPTALRYNVISVFFNSGNKIQIFPLNSLPDNVSELEYCRRCLFCCQTHRSPWVKLIGRTRAHGPDLMAATPSPSSNNAQLLLWQFNFVVHSHCMHCMSSYMHCVLWCHNFHTACGSL